MTVQHDDTVVQATKTVHDKVWYKHWREGERSLRPPQVIDYVREVRELLGVPEDQLPTPLKTLLTVARVKRDADTPEVISLVSVIEPFKQVILPAA